MDGLSTLWLPEEEGEEEGEDVESGGALVNEPTMSVVEVVLIVKPERVEAVVVETTIVDVEEVEVATDVEDAETTIEVEVEVGTAEVLESSDVISEDEEIKEDSELVADDVV